jgi:hypothetical protein
MLEEGKGKKRPHGMGQKNVTLQMVTTASLIAKEPGTFRSITFIQLWIPSTYLAT